MEASGTETLPRLPKVFKVHDFDILSAIEPHFNGYRMNSSCPHGHHGCTRVGEIPAAKLGPLYTEHGRPVRGPTDPVSIFRSLVPYMTDDIRYPTERYINIFGTIQV